MMDDLPASAIGGSFLVVLAHTFLTAVFRKAVDIAFPYEHITINQYRGPHMQRNELYIAAEAYLSKACSSRASKLKAELGKEDDRPVVTIDDGEGVSDTFKGAKVWWQARKRSPSATTISNGPQDDERKYYRLRFNKRQRKLVEDEYLEYIRKEGDAARVSNQKRRLFTNNPTSNRRGLTWSHVPFEHPSNFDTLAMDAQKKKDIIDDLIIFRNGKEFYKKIGKAWKRGYLLYGPPGTGKSSMIAAIANFLEYDVYDLELTAIKTNTNLRKIFTEITSKAVIVIEDIDCSIDLTNKRKEKKKEKDDEEKEIMLPEQEEKEENGKLTLSGLLNFIDGLWSACGGERIIIFTTNHLEKLDPALIRRGRMDKQIEMSYCKFEAFKVLAKNYLRVEQHELFGTIETLLSEVNITPADVAEELMPKRSIEDDVGESLKNLIKVMEDKKKADAEDAAKEKEKLKGESSA
ncbi:P-loop containing nucleoside triphosphate hydrolases superfamily protein [Rhynchospora pubera]|uniref:P-loop containing nucleoside triphosphate hydrolases superfamily protein n=1 Tax=Rhynchospora pubera TaxID=906938 RepID=A0AAV8DMS8_9POAL|nr:P-loop containing nucleoside triphosphate hydrolases superfamily protein [Rhynchospora pubera]